MAVPPKNVQEIAQRALDIRAELPPSSRAGTPVGIARARDLARGADLSNNTLVRMYSYLMRAKFDYDDARKQGKDIRNSRAIMAYHLWGSSAALAWVRRELGK
jgi:hypothetical protein